MTVEIPHSDTPAVVEAVDYEDRRLQTLADTGLANGYTIGLMRGADPTGPEDVASERETIPEATFVVPRRISRRGGRSIPEVSGRDLALQKDAEMRKAEKDRPVAAADSIPKALAFSILEALRKGDRERHAQLLKKLDAHERGEVVSLSDSDDDEVA